MKKTRTFAARLTLLVTLVTGAAVVLVSLAHIGLEIRRMRALATDLVGAQARVIAANSTAALDFDDPEAAQATLQGLLAVPEFAAASITRAGAEPDGPPFATFDRQTGVPRRPLASIARPDFRGRWLTFAQPIERDGEHIGDVHLLYDLAPLQRRLLAEIVLALTVALATIALAFFAARRIQRSLLRPVRELSTAAEAIAASDDFSIRASKVSEDELGALTDVFNSMIHRIGEAEALRRNHRRMLEEEVARRTQEVIETQTRLRQSERMASLGTLSAGLGHDIGNLLMPLRSHLSALRERVGGPAAERDFAAIDRATEYLQNLSASLRIFAQDPYGADLRRDPTPLHLWWPRMEPLLRAMIGRGIRLEHDIPEDLPPVRLSQSLLMQAVFNLAQNAAQAIAPEGESPPGSRIRVSAEAVPASNGPERVAISVSDNGPGMSEEVRRRCLEPYFTTKTRRISSGLGLALVHGIVQSAGGELRIESAPGAGSTFRLFLPAAPPETNTAAPAVVTLSDARRRAVVSHLLRALNCDVRPLPPEGEAAREVGERPDALWVTDSLDLVPAAWRGRVVLMAGEPAQTAGHHDHRVTVLDPAAPMPELRVSFRRFVQGG